MSGLCVIVTFDGAPVEPDAVDAMCRAASHRGPDGTRSWQGRGVRLAHQALHLVTGEEARPQPVVAGRLVVVADARLDNRRELITALQRSGALPPGQDALTDAEVILAAYRRWDTRCADRLIGDFSFVIWDGRRRRLTAARDPLGVRGLAYRIEPGRRVLVATEVKQIAAAPGVPARIFEPAVAADLVAHFGRPEWSFFEGIALLAPGHVLVCDRDGHRLRRFWDVDPDFQIENVDRRADAEQLRDVFCQAVEARLRTPKPAGILLSGGVDSGSVASAAGWLMEQGRVDAPGLQAASWAFTALPQCDERHVSRHINARYGLGCLEIPGDDAGPLACFPEHLPDRDDPMLGAFQPLIEHALVALRQAGAGVVLGGDRGDLVIGDTGYSYRRMAQSQQWAMLRAELQAHRRALGDPTALILKRYLIDAVAHRLRRRSPVEWGRWVFDKARARFDPPPAGRPYPPWLTPSFVQRTGVPNLLSEPDHVPAGLLHTRAERYRWIFTQLHLRGVAWSERTYARHGLGFADPFSDARMVALAIALPQQVINRPGDQSKPLMREAMRGIMPEPALTEADKILPTPLYERFLRDRAAPIVRDLLTNSQVGQRGWVDERIMRDSYDGWVAGRPLPAEFWWTLAVELWLRVHWV